MSLLSINLKVDPPYTQINSFLNLFEIKKIVILFRLFQSIPNGIPFGDKSIEKV